MLNRYSNSCIKNRTMFRSTHKSLKPCIQSSSKFCNLTVFLGGHLTLGNSNLGKHMPFPISKQKQRAWEKGPPITGSEWEDSRCQCCHPPIHRQRGRERSLQSQNRSSPRRDGWNGRSSGTPRREAVPDRRTGNRAWISRDSRKSWRTDQRRQPWSRRPGTERPAPAPPTLIDSPLWCKPFDLRKPNSAENTKLKSLIGNSSAGGERK